MRRRTAARARLINWLHMELLKAILLDDKERTAQINKAIVTHAVALAAEALGSYKGQQDIAKILRIEQP